MRFAVRLLRYRGRILPWREVINRPTLVGDLRIEEVRDEELRRYLRTAKRAEPEANRAKPAERSGGSGIAWLSDYGYVVTANHVVAGASKISLLGHDRKPIPAKIIATDSANDLAILDVDFPVPAPSGLGIAKAPAGLGAKVFTIGYPHPELMGIEPKYTSGEVSALSGLGDDRRIVQISVPVQNGNSGGPLLNANGASRMS